MKFENTIEELTENKEELERKFHEHMEALELLSTAIEELL
jgi:prefoldin subunit 5